MYLMKYVLFAMIFAASFLFVLRTCSSSELKTAQGITSRALLSILLLAFVAIIWYYSGAKYFDYKWVNIGAKIVSVALYIAVLPDVWADKSNNIKLDNHQSSTKETADTSETKAE